MTPGASHGRLRSLGHASAVSATLVIVALIIVFWVYGIVGPPAWRFSGLDLDVYTEATRRLLAGGSWYVDRQLHGPYDILQGDVLYPPVTAWFFAPWLLMPGWTFSAIPVAITAWIVWRFRPVPYAWPLIALCVLWPIVPLKTIRLNPSVWLMAAVALGLRYRWPGALVLLKPSMAPFALIGIRSRGWWAVVALIAIGCLPFISATLAYPKVVLDGRGGGLIYSLPDVPFLLIPLLAWLARGDRQAPSIGERLDAGQ